MPEGQTPSPQEALARGVEAHRTGRVEEALRWYRTAFELAPGDAEAASLYGLALVHAGRFEEAESLLRDAVEREPEQMGFRLNLCELLENTGRSAEALQMLREALSDAAGHWPAWLRLGDLYSGHGQHEQARGAYLRAAALQPRHPEVIVRLARSDLRAGNIAAGLSVMRSAVAANPRDGRLSTLYCDMLIQQGRWGELEAQTRIRLRADSRDTGAWRNLSRACFEQGRYLAALDAYSRVLEISGRDAPSLSVYARLAMHALEFDTAAEALDEAEKMSPEHAELLAARAHLLTTLGRFDEARRYCRRCLVQSPEFVPVYTTLSRLDHGHLSETEMATLSRIAAREGTPLDHRIPSAFALGHAYDARDETGPAFQAYSNAHALGIQRDQREGRRYDPALTEERTARLMVPMPAPGHSLEALPDPDCAPIFIVGMPRSGTTLIEAVLSAHSRVRAGGERPHMQQILSASLQLSGRQPDDRQLMAWREAYLRETSGSRRADYLTDKHPLNFEAVGLIAALFPRSAIIHVRRNPVETAWSIYRNEFSKFWAFTHRLEDIGHFYGQYARLAAHWEREFGRRFLTVQYEDFAAAFDTTAPALVAACGLEWEEQCRNFQKAPRPIFTFSAVQARGPVRVHSGAAARYRPYLEPLIDSLNRAGVDLATGALLPSAH